MKTKTGLLLGGLALGLLSMGALRYSATHANLLTPISGLATPGYVLTTVLFAIWLARAGVPYARFGFGQRPGLQHVALAVVAVVALRIVALAISPALEELLGGPRNLERFADVKASPASLAALLAMSWTFAAFGEELAYRIVLMRGIAFLLGDTRSAMIIALLLQALIFGLAHAYQGPAGVAGAALSGVVFGVVTLAGRWSIWPAALAHGVNNTFGILALYRG